MKKFSVVGLLVAIAGLVFFNLKKTTNDSEVGESRNQLLIVSEEQMTQSANQSYAQIIAEAKSKGVLNKDANTTKRVKTIANNLIKQAPALREDCKNWDWQVNVITESTVNAWCMAGGKIVVYTGIIDALKLTDGELAAVIGHEISHALKEHSREQVSRQQVTSMGIQAVAQLFDLGTTGQSIMDVAAQYALTLPHGRSQETEADNLGTELMARAGYDPNEAVNVWKKMSQLSSGGTPEFMSTHPSNESRIENLKVISQKVEKLYLQAK